MGIENENTTSRDFIRYVLWGLMAFTAESNRREYQMTTTWLPHFAANTLSLLLPDALRFLLRRRARNVVEETLIKMVRDNPDYVIYVAPLALGYITSHPRFNIYKGELAEIEVAGLHLDAIPHSATAFALGAMIWDTLDTAAHQDGYEGLLCDLLRWSDQNSVAVSFSVLALLTFLWEYGEYRMHHHEMGLRGDLSKINMMWTVDDTARDVLANVVGWGLAMLWRWNTSKR